MKGTQCVHAAGRRLLLFEGGGDIGKGRWLSALCWKGLNQRQAL